MNHSINLKKLYEKSIQNTEIALLIDFKHCKQHNPLNTIKFYYMKRQYLQILFLCRSSMC